MPTKHSVFGDSISTFRGIIPEENRWYYDAADTNRTGVTAPDDTWWMHAIRHDGGEFLANASFSGSMVQGAGFPAGRSRERALQVLGPDGEAPDVVWVFIGINDYGWGSPEAQVAGGSEAAPECADSLSVVDPAGVAPANAAERFGDAYAEMLFNIKEVAPDAEVRCLTLLPGRAPGCDETAFCFTLRGVDIEEYNAAIRRAAAAAGAVVVDVAALGCDYDSTDGTHPTKEGMRQLAELVAAAMGEQQALAEYPTRLMTTRRCVHPGEKCDRAEITPNRWSCVSK